MPATDRQDAVLNYALFVLSIQATFWRTESKCRKLIEQTTMAVRSPKDIKSVMVGKWDKGGEE